MERAEICDVPSGQGPPCRFAQLVLLAIPGRLLEADVEVLHLVQKNFVQGLDRVASLRLPERPAEEAGLAASLAAIEVVVLHVEQAEQRVPRPDVDIEVRVRADETEEPGSRRFGRFREDVHAVEVRGENPLLHPVAERGILGPRLLDLLPQLAVAHELDALDHRGVEVEQHVERRHQEIPGAAGRIEDREARQDLLPELAAEARVEPQQKIRDRVEPPASLHSLADPIEESGMDRRLAQVPQDLRSGLEVEPHRFAYPSVTLSVRMVRYSSTREKRKGSAPP